MSKFLFVLSRGPEDPTRVARTFQLAKVAKDKGHDVVMFLVDDAVYLSNMTLAEHVQAPTGDVFVEHMRSLVERGAPILLCKPCAAARLIGEDELPPGWSIGTAMQLIDMAAEPGTQVFSF